jgi:hypothetical protein
MAYSASYSDADISSAAIDGVVKIIIAFASLATLVGLALVYGMLKKQWKGQ